MTNSSFNNITIFNKTIKNNNYINKNYNINKIKMWTGNTPPSGYVWCDGNNGTPNLKNKFIYFINSSSNTLTNVGNNIINDMPSHNHNVSNVHINKDINNTTNSLRINRLYYLMYNKTGSVSGGNNTKRTTSGAGSTGKSHFHDIDNSNGNSFKNNIQIEQFSPSSSNPLNITKQSNFNTNNIISSSSSVQQGSQEEFEPRYIYIGFIMKI